MVTTPSQRCQPAHEFARKCRVISDPVGLHIGVPCFGVLIILHTGVPYVGVLLIRILLFRVLDSCVGNSHIPPNNRRLNRVWSWDTWYHNMGEVKLLVEAAPCAHTQMDNHMN